MKSYLAGGILCGTLVVVVGLWRPGTLGASRSARSTPTDSSPARSRVSPIVGTSSCAGPSCHGQEQPRADDKSKVRLDEYRLWNLWDPHAHAYHALEGQHAQRIIAKLAPLGEWKEATQEARCLVCHTDPFLATESADEDRRVHGVGCESCHGPAKRWLDPHHAKPPKPREELEQLGMRSLGNVGTLAEVCVGCHVGAAASEGQPAREVTHDLLAAEHPRMNFELTSYLANLPPHWQVRKRKPDFEAAAWAAGQVMTAQASLQLLAYQARREGPWPEFAAYDCEGCHTPLGLRAKPSGKTPSLSRWPFALLPEIGASLPLPVSNTRRMTEQLAELKDLLKRQQPNSVPIAEKADKLAKNLEGWRRALAQWQVEPATLMERIGRHSPDDFWNWEEATQRYLALWALEQARNEKGIGEQNRLIQNELLELADKLAFPPSYSGPREYSDESLRQNFRKIQRQLREENSEAPKNPRGY